MAGIAGIDEAGLGPLLGPLCFGFASFSAPQRCDLWQALGNAVSRKSGETGKLAVADSKKLFPGGHGLARLEETALAFHHALWNSLPDTLEELLRRTPLPVSSETLDRHPWYRDRGLALPRRAEKETILEKSQRLAAALRESGIRLEACGSQPVPEGELNESFRSTGNKSSTHFEKGAPPLRWIAERHLGKGGTIWIDRHGMRRHYGPLLATLFPGFQLWVLDERRRESRYRLEGEAGSVEIRFVEKGEERAFPVALASIFAKYTRELLMECWNGYFARIAPGVRRTAGYYTDARRYLREAGEAIRREGIPDELLIRER